MGDAIPVKGDGETPSPPWKDAPDDIKKQFYYMIGFIHWQPAGQRIG